MVRKSIGIIGLKGLPAYGGAATVGENIINQLKDKYSFTVYSTASHTDKKTGYYNGIQQIVFRKLPFKKINSLYYYLISTFHSLFFGNYDLIHLHHRDAAFITILLKLRYNVILTTHNSFYYWEKFKNIEWYLKLNEKYFVKKADIVTCVSEYESRQYKELLNINAIFIPNGINISENLQLNGERNDDYLFFSAGRIIRSKGLDILLRAIKNIELNCKLLIAGDIEQTPKYKKEILTLSKNINVEFLGLIKNKNKLLEYIRNCKLFIYPSSYEAMSIMLLEAASQKVPIICSDISPNSAVFNDDEVLFFKVNDVDDLGAKIKWALDNMPGMQAKIEKAYLKLKTKYQWKDIAKEYDKLFTKLM